MIEKEPYKCLKIRLFFLNFAKFCLLLSSFYTGEALSNQNFDAVHSVALERDRTFPKNSNNWDTNQIEDETILSNRR